MLASLTQRSIPFALVATLAAIPSEAAAAPDPVELLRKSVETLASAPSASVKFLDETTLVRNDREDVTGSEYQYRTAPEGRFEFVSVNPEGGEPRRGYRVAGNGRVTLTQLISRRRHMLAEDDGGFASFIRSPSAQSMGSGLGNLALSVLSGPTGEELANNVTSSEYLGEVEIDGEPLHHVRFTVQETVTFDAWFTTDERSLIRRIVPDLSQDPGVKQMASRFETFEYSQRFEFSDWDTDAAVSAEELEVVEPKNSILMASFYRRPPKPPHHLLGKEAPGFDLPTPNGERVNFAERGEDEVTLIEFWSTGCPVCVQAMPQLEEIGERYAERGLKYRAINLGEEPSDVAAFLEARGLSPETLVDTEGDVADKYRVGSIPLILLVGKEGKVQVAQAGFGPRSAAQLAEQAEALLEGEDLSAAAVAEWEATQARQVAERDRLRSLLDG